MRVKTSLDWDTVNVPLLAQLHSAPQAARKDLARFLATVTGLVQELGREEVEMRRCKRTTSIRQQELLLQIDDAITTFEQYLMWAHLSYA